VNDSTGDLNMAVTRGAELENEPLSRLAISRIREMIVQGRLHPGSRVSERGLCEAFGISRTPLREALKVLASEGLVDLLPRRGARVTKLELTRLHEQFESVALLEAHAAQHLCEIGTDSQLRDLRLIHNALTSAHQAHDPARYYISNEQFHRAIVVLMANRTLADIHAALIVHIHRARNVALNRSDIDAKFAHAHNDIMHAIERRDGEGAAKVVKEHQREIARTVLAALGAAAKSSAAQGH
jgi:DNA-binding GntR family transcriptional regulator